MSLTQAAIDQTVERYRREYDCYLKLARFVAERCEKEIIRANTLRAAVTFRAKAVDRLREKLTRKYSDRDDISTADEVLRNLTDLAGVRVSTYQEQDRDRVVDEIKKLFDGPASEGRVEVDKKDEGQGFYRATHCQVRLKEEDLEEPYENLAGLTCEIQVCSMLAHVWNEIEHDLRYKPTTGDLSDREDESLDILGNLTLSGDVVIKQLFDSNAQRLAQQADGETPFQDVYDFVARIRQHFPDATDFGANAGQLFEEIMSLGINSPTAIKTELLQGDFSARAAHLLARLSQHMAASNESPVELQARSSDPLLMLLLDRHVADVLDQHPMGRGRGRPPRIASIAARFRDMPSAREEQDPEPTPG